MHKNNTRAGFTNSSVPDLRGSAARLRYFSEEHKMYPGIFC